MTLKKSDKIIAIIGVVILIVAAVGIYIYAGTEEEPEKSKEEEATFFEIAYEEKTMTALPDNQDYSIKPKLFGKSTYKGIVEISQQNLKSVDVFVDYTDTKVGFLNIIGFLKFIGQDTITITIYDSQENEIGSAKIKGDGNETINIMDGDMISLEPIEADNINDAELLLTERYIDYFETYTIHISLKTGLMGKIREILGKDAFQLEVTYSYYDYYIMERMPGNETDGDLPPTGGNQGSQTWFPMGYPGMH